MAQPSLWYSLATNSMKAVLYFNSSSLVMVSRRRLLVMIASSSTSSAGTYITYSRPWSDTQQPWSLKNAILFCSASFKVAKLVTLTPLTLERVSI